MMSFKIRYLFFLVILFVFVFSFTFVSAFSLGDFFKGLFSKGGITGNPITEYCYDSDSGIDFYVKGIVSHSSGNYTDICYISEDISSDSLTASVVAPLPKTFIREYYCQGNSVLNKDYQCACSDGACISIENGSCGTTLNSCSVGMFIDMADNSTHYRWRCFGTGGGSIATCSLPSSNCAPESNTTFCSRLGKNCGSLISTDNCGATRKVDSCGTCISPQTCGGSATPNVCGGSATYTPNPFIVQKGSNVILTINNVSSGATMVVGITKPNVASIGQINQVTHQITINGISVGSAVIYVDDNNDNNLVHIPVQVIESRSTPIVSIIEPKSKSEYLSPKDIILLANASNQDGQIFQVDFINYYDQTTSSLCSVRNFPYSCTWYNITHGYYYIVARATDNLGGSNISEPIEIIVYKSNPTGICLANGTDILINLVNQKIERCKTRACKVFFEEGDILRENDYIVLYSPDSVNKEMFLEAYHIRCYENSCDFVLKDLITAQYFRFENSFNSRDDINDEKFYFRLVNTSEPSIQLTRGYHSSFGDVGATKEVFNGSCFLEYVVENSQLFLSIKENLTNQAVNNAKIFLFNPKGILIAINETNYGSPSFFNITLDSFKQNGQLLLNYSLLITSDGYFNKTFDLAFIPNQPLNLDILLDRIPLKLNNISIKPPYPSDIHNVGDIFTLNIEIENFTNTRVRNPNAIINSAYISEVIPITCNISLSRENVFICSGIWNSINALIGYNNYTIIFNFQDYIDTQYEYVKKVDLSFIKVNTSLCKELIQGHNNPNVQRANIVFVGYGYDNPFIIPDRESCFRAYTQYCFKELKYIAAYGEFTTRGENITFTCSSPTNKSLPTEIQVTIPLNNLNLYNNSCTKIDRNSSEVWPALAKLMIDYNGENYGLLSVPPYKNNLDKFNFWYVDKLGSLSECDKYNQCHSSESLEDSCLFSNSYLTQVIDLPFRSSAGYGLKVKLSHPLIGTEYGALDGPRRFTHEFTHQFANLGDEYLEHTGTSPPGYSRKNCYPSPSQQECLNNVTWKSLIGTGCGEEGIIDCQQDDPNYRIEVGCFEGCYFQYGIYSSTRNSIMRHYNYAPYSFGSWNEKLIKEEIDKFRGV